jgi:hypothetical protein
MYFKNLLILMIYKILTLHIIKISKFLKYISKILIFNV